MGRRYHEIVLAASVVVLLLLFAGCKESPLSLQGVLLPPAELLERLGGSSVSAPLSPNGHWIASPWVVKSPIRIFDALEGNIVFTTTLPSSDVGASLRGWSPDSSYLAYATMEEGCQMCPYSHLILIDVGEPPHPLQTHLYDLPPDNYHIETFWFPQSDRLAVLVDWKQLIVLDRQAALQASLNTPLCDAEYILDVEAVDSERLFLVTGPLVPARHAPSEIQYNLCEVTGERLEEHRLLYRGSQRIEIVAYHPEKLLLALPAGEVDMTLRVFDPAQRRVAETIEMQGTTIRSASSFGAWTAISLRRGYGEDHLLVFDWNTYRLTDHGEILELIGWQDRMAGFLVTRGQWDDEASWCFDVVRP